MIVHDTYIEWRYTDGPVVRLATVRGGPTDQMWAPSHCSRVRGPLSLYPNGPMSRPWVRLCSIVVILFKRL